MNHLRWRGFLDSMIPEIIPDNLSFMLEPSFYNFTLDQPIAFKYTLCLPDTPSLEREKSYKFVPVQQNMYRYDNGKKAPQDQMAHINQKNYGSIEISYPNNNKFSLDFGEKGIFFNISKEKENEFSKYNRELRVRFIPTLSHMPCSISYLWRT